MLGHLIHLMHGNGDLLNGGGLAAAGLRHVAHQSGIFIDSGDDALEFARRI